MSRLSLILAVLTACGPSFGPSVDPPHDAEEVTRIAWDFWTSEVGVTGPPPDVIWIEGDCIEGELGVDCVSGRSFGDWIVVAHRNSAADSMLSHELLHSAMWVAGYSDRKHESILWDQMVRLEEILERKGF